jgi:hypothetical protein
MNAHDVCTESFRRSAQYVTLVTMAQRFDAVEEFMSGAKRKLGAAFPLARCAFASRLTLEQLPGDVTNNLQRPCRQLVDRVVDRVVMCVIEVDHVDDAQPFVE